MIHKQITAKNIVLYNQKMATSKWKEREELISRIQ